MADRSDSRTSAEAEFVFAGWRRRLARLSHAERSQASASFSLAACLSLLLAAAPAAAADLLQAEQLYRSGKYADCVDYAAKALAASEFNEEWPLLKIKSELALGRYPDALKTLDAALASFEFSVQLRWLGREVCRFNGQGERGEKLIVEMADLVRQTAWRFRDPPNQVVLGRFFLEQGVDAKQVLDNLYNEIKKRQPDDPHAYLASGELALAKHDYGLAAEAFEQAVKLDKDDPEAHFGLAQAYSASDSDKAATALQAALALNPNHIDSLLFLVDDHVDSERYDEAAALLDRIEKINPEHPRACAYRAVLAHLAGKPEEEARCYQRALAHWPANPEADYLIGKKLSQKYRFAEGAARQRLALAFDSNYLPAKVQLAQDLLRLGEEEEGWRLADDVYDKDGYNVVAHNLVTLEENLRKFRTLEGDGFQLRMDPREASIYGRRVLELLQRAKQTLCAKYEVTIDEPVVVELFPRQQDFAIRTFGLPGGAGFLGVCFGRVITANSPASQGETPASWEATLWHEFCHVVTLHKTHNKMPRWLSEGISVYEERQAERTWGQTITPRYREMLLADDLTPVSQLSGAFLHPATPQHLQFAYYESSLAVEYLVDKYGLETLKRVLVDLGAGMPINDSLSRYAGSLEALDKEFAEFARTRARQMAPEADWSEPDLPPTAGAEEVVAWLEKHPKNYAALGRRAKQLLDAKKWQEAKAPLEEMVRLYPEGVGAGNPYAMLAKAHRELGETAEERAALEKIAGLTADEPDALLRLMELAAAAEDWPTVTKHGLRMLAVNPLLKTPHRQLAAAAEHTGDDALAIEAYGALLLLDPIDLAELHYRLAVRLHRTGDLGGARRHALEALEEAPRYRAAQRELLAIVEKMDEVAKPVEPPGGSAPGAEDQGSAGR
ncbi:MAG TPA: tetratricopeptide repeat protein [Pirellulales bacterium]|nr:tetratricopeptide repeat protein [Pirellulales bacterium]